MTQLEKAIGLVNALASRGVGAWRGPLKELQYLLDANQNTGYGDHDGTITPELWIQLKGIVDSALALSRNLKAWETAL